MLLACAISHCSSIPVMQEEPIDTVATSYNRQSTHPGVNWVPVQLTGRPIA